jgi:hypothetical protein
MAPVRRHPVTKPCMAYRLGLTLVRPDQISIVILITSSRHLRTLRKLKSSNDGLKSGKKHVDGIRPNLNLGSDIGHVPHGASKPAAMNAKEQQRAFETVILPTERLSISSVIRVLDEFLVNLPAVMAGQTLPTQPTRNRSP